MPHHIGQNLQAPSSALSDITDDRRRLMHPSPRRNRSKPPNDSIVRAISGADIVSVPLVNKSPVMLAVPGEMRRIDLSAAPHDHLGGEQRQIGRSATITRKPFSSLVSFGVGEFCHMGRRGRRRRVDATDCPG